MSITKVEIAAEIRRLATENPDRVAPCMYLSDYNDTSNRKFFDDDSSEFPSGYTPPQPDPEASPVCIVGTAVFNLFENKDEARGLLRSCEDAGAVVVVQNVDDEVLGFPHNDQVLNWIDTVQSQQDQGLTWGEALAVADINVPHAFPSTHFGEDTESEEDYQ